MQEILKEKLANLPQNPGVYQYFDKEGKLLYVGKAKNLKNRVRSYLSAQSSARIQKMINEAVHLEVITTHSEADALILENSLIKQLHPKYNILLRDDKTYPYIYVDLSEEFPSFKSTRRLIKKSKIKYYGPFFKGAKQLLEALYLYYPLRQRQGCKRACIFHQIARCPAPCEGKISPEAYGEILARATKALLNPSLLIENLQKQMLKLSKNEHYEEAAKLRDSIRVLRELEVRVELDLARLEDFEIFALAWEKNLACLLRFVVQEGKIISAHSRLCPLKSEEEPDKNSLYKQFILENFNSDTPLIAPKIYLYEDFEDRPLLEDLLSKRFGKKIRLIRPQQAQKRKICDLAFQNALLQIHNALKKTDLHFMQDFMRYFALENFPGRIEIFDCSHLQGVARVGAMVCFEGGRWHKEAYRRYHLSGRGDFEQMRELLTRRAKDFQSLPAPDLWLIDGGSVLLNLAKSIIKSSGANVDILAIAKEKIDAKAHRAKGAARDKIHSLLGEFRLDSADKKLQFLQKLRDEAHRFALDFHRKAREKQDLASSRLTKAGLSGAVVDKLLNFYGDFEGIHAAEFEELAGLVGAKNARKIKDAF